MKRSIAIAALGAVIVLLGACSTLPSQRLGSIKQVTNHELQVCFDAKVTPPMAGQEVQLVRREQTGNPKFGPTFRERSVGTARIASETSGCCVTATLIQGKA